MSDAFEMTLPLSSVAKEKHPRLKLVFNNSTYKAIKAKTGKNVFELGQNNTMQDPEILAGILFAATRKHHTNPLVSDEQIDEWLDDVDPFDLITSVYPDIMTGFNASFLDPQKRQAFLEDQAKGKKERLQKLSEMDTKPKESGSNTLSTPSKAA